MVRSLYVVANPIRMGIGPMSDEDIASLQEYAETVLNDLFFSMSSESQVRDLPKKSECVDLLEDAKRTRETSDYISATRCLDEARAIWQEIADREQAEVEAKSESCPDGICITPVPEASSPPSLPAPKKAEEPEGFGTMGWVLIGGAALLLVGAVASAVSR